MRAGPGNGVSMEFDVQFDEYLPSTTASGLKVLIHDNGVKPFPEDGGIMAGTGAATSVAIKKVVGLGTVEKQRQGGREDREKRRESGVCLFGKGEGGGWLSLVSPQESAPWPTRDYRQTLLRRHGLDLNATQLLEAGERSFLKLEIYFDSLILDKIVGRPAFTWNKLLSDIGGQLGLLLGFSILTAIEIFELVVMELGLGIGLRSLWRRQF
ncbi:acid-sensing ion channel 1 [Plakobranchus ocellatus]|uniref:Acid-sensing ion channel 1 n=1 Tax=Plakobranchus ocellatus TaxID=259542 RepID=A0AAV4E424_9GAST|nr:acid-sensing ion channel 1 [Plakobranchus ocellatus]